MNPLLFSLMVTLDKIAFPVIIISGVFAFGSLVVLSFTSERIVRISEVTAYSGGTIIFVSLSTAVRLI